MNDVYLFVSFKRNGGDNSYKLRVKRRYHKLLYCRDTFRKYPWDKFKQDHSGMSNIYMKNSFFNFYQYDKKLLYSEYEIDQNETGSDQSCFLLTKDYFLIMSRAQSEIEWRKLEGGESGIVIFDMFHQYEINQMKGLEGNIIAVNSVLNYINNKVAILDVDTFLQKEILEWSETFKNNHRKFKLDFVPVGLNSTHNFICNQLKYELEVINRKDNTSSMIQVKEKDMIDHDHYEKFYLTKMACTATHMVLTSVSILKSNDTIYDYLLVCIDILKMEIVDVEKILRFDFNNHDGNTLETWAVANSIYAVVINMENKYKVYRFGRNKFECLIDSKVHDKFFHRLMKKMNYEFPRSIFKWDDLNKCLNLWISNFVRDEVEQSGNEKEQMKNGAYNVSKEKVKDLKGKRTGEPTKTLLLSLYTINLNYL